ncbi:SRPBCC domain-containing protein, partial [Domibacillus tundrae]
VEPEKIVYTDSFSDAEGNTMEEMPSIQITILFVEHEDNTKLIVRSQFASAEALQQVMDMGVVQGFSSQFDGLDDLLKALQLGSK